MKAKLLTLFSLLALLLVSTAILADGRPTGIRIGRAVSGGDANVEIDITVTDTDYWYSTGGWGSQSTVWIGNQMGWTFNAEPRQYASNNFSDPLPWAIDWGDGYYFGDAVLFGSPSGPWQGTFSHTYSVPGSYTIVAGDFFCDDSGGKNTCKPTFPATSIGTGNVIIGTRYISATWDTDTFDDTDSILAITNTAVITTGTGIPTLNIYGLLAMAFVLVGTGVLLFRKPTVA